MFIYYAVVCRLARKENTTSSLTDLTLLILLHKLVKKGCTIDC